jgi:diphosphomevalonate decarboxylase
VIKYWGKRDSKLILPTNSSLSVTLNQDDLRTTTTVRLMDEGTDTVHDRLYLNGQVQPIEKDSRLDVCLSQLRKLKADLENKTGQKHDETSSSAVVR